MDLKKRAQNARIWAQNNGISKEKFAECVCRVFDGDDLQKSHKHKFFRLLTAIFKCLIGILTLFVILYTIISCHDSTQNYITRSIQDLIYPFMRFFRIWTLFLHYKFPHLHEWHEEECLIRNPFYQNPDLSCWPCENVNTVIDVTGFRNFSEVYYHNGTPFIVKDASNTEISFTTLQILYSTNKESLLSGTTSFYTNIAGIDSPKQLFDCTRDQRSDVRMQNKFVLWRFGRVGAARVLRTTFPRPYFIPNKTEVALERFLILSGPNSGYLNLPLTDFANVWLTQGYGISVVTLESSPPCKSICKSVSVHLHPQETLFYNWQFWRPKISTLNQSQISVLYVGSFY